MTTPPPTITVTISGPIRSGVTLVQAQLVAALHGLGLYVTLSGDASVKEILNRTKDPDPYVAGMLAKGVRITVETKQSPRAAVETYPVRPDNVSFPERGIVVPPLERDGDGWTVSESIAGTCVSFPTRKTALEMVKFYRSYVRRWGFVNLASAPMYESDTPVMFTMEHVAVAFLDKVHAELRRRGVPGVPS